jgi:hypothetical protein
MMMAARASLSAVWRTDLLDEAGLLPARPRDSFGSSMLLLRLMMTNKQPD